MRVGLLTTSYPRFEGDFRGIFIEKLVQAIEARGQGVQVEVIEPRGYSALKQGAGLLPNLGTSALARLEFPFYCAHFLFLAVVKAFRCDLLHANWSLSGFFAVLAGRLTRTKVLVTERGQFLIDSKSRPVNAWLRWVLGRATVRVVISESARQAMQRKFPGLSFEVIPNGVDDAAISPARRASAKKELGLDGRLVHIVSVGRLTAVKRLDTFVRALGTLVDGAADFHAWIIGEGEARGPLADAVEARGLGERVTFVGAVPPDDAALWMCAGDVFVLCSEGEGGGNVVLEAMSAGMAVVSTPVGWARDFIADGENGLLFPVGDADALASRLAAVVGSRDLASRLGSAARRTIDERQLNWAGCADRYLELYRNLTGR